MRAHVGRMACHMPHLLMAAQVVVDAGRASQGLVDLHGAATWVGKHLLHTLPLQGLHQNVTPLPGLVSIAIHPLACWSACRQTIARRLGSIAVMEVCRCPCWHKSVTSAKVAAGRMATYWSWRLQLGRPPSLHESVHADTMPQISCQSLTACLITACNTLQLALSSSTATPHLCGFSLPWPVSKLCLHSA